MKKYIITIFAILLCLAINANAPKKQNSAASKSQIKVVKNPTTTTKVVNSTTQNIPERKAILNFDSIIKNMNSLVLPDKLHGYWKYEKTMEFRGEQQPEYTRQYYNLDKEDNINTTQGATTPDMMDPIKMRQMEQEQAIKMGRTNISQEDLIIVYDPNVSYFFWNQGNGNQLFVIQKVKDKNVTYLNAADTRYSITKDEKSGKYSLNLVCPENGKNKKFLILSITDDQMILADLEYKEIQFFNKSTR